MTMQEEHDENGEALSIDDKEHLRLQKLVNQMVKLPSDEPDEHSAPPVPISKITHHQIAAMKSTVVAHTEAKKAQPEDKSFMVSFFQFLDDFKVMMMPEAKRTRCRLEGHECKNCGAHINFVEEPEEEKGPKRR